MPCFYLAVHIVGNLEFLLVRNSCETFDSWNYRPGINLLLCENVLNPQSTPNWLKFAQISYKQYNSRFSRPNDDLFIFNTKVIYQTLHKKGVVRAVALDISKNLWQGLTWGLHVLTVTFHINAATLGALASGLY